MGERTIDARSDVYALGAVLYEMLVGDAPFIGSSVQAIVAKVLSEKPTPIHTLRDTVPLAIEQAVSTALWHWRTKVAGSGSALFSPPERWFRDPLMINTVSRSHLITPDGADLYLRGSGRSTGAYLRVIPNWVATMKRAVDAAGK